MPDNQTPNYSIVIPFMNEEANVEALINEIEPVMKKMGDSFELIAVEDGSTDNTYAILKDLKSSRPWLKILKFDKNYGQSSAFDAGFKTATGKYVITLDGDRQNDPRDIPRMAQAIESADLLCGRRLKRKDPFTKRIISKAANFIRSRLCPDGVQDTGCSLKMYRRESLNRIKMFHGMHRFCPLSLL